MQRFREGPARAFRIAALEAAHSDGQDCGKPHLLRALEPPLAVAVNMAASLTAVGTHGRVPSHTGLDHESAIRTLHIHQDYAVFLADFHDYRLNSSQYLRKSGFLTNFARCRFAVFCFCFHM